MAQRFLLSIFGRRIVVLFGAISFLMAAVLAALYVTSGYAVQSYVSDQLDRIPWDVSAGQRDAVRASGQFQSRLKTVPGVEEVEGLGILRVVNAPPAVHLELDGLPLPVHWLVLVSTTDPRLLPPALQPVPGPQETEGSQSALARAALVSARDIEFGPVRLLPGSELRLRKGSPTEENEETAPAEHGDGDDQHHGQLITLAADTPDLLFKAQLAAGVQIERQEFNKWMLRSVGSISYLPEAAIVVVVPTGELQRVADLLENAFGASEGIHGGAAAPPYVPEMTHLIRLDRERWITPWQFEKSLGALRALQVSILAGIQELTIFSYVRSDAFTTLDRMNQISKLLGAVSLLVAIPLLWLGWAVAQMLGRLLLMNERRLIGLALLRGVPSSLIARAVITALVAGGVLGALLGLIAGLGIPILVQSIAGHPAPPASVLLQGSLYFAGFAAMSIALAVISGWSMIRRIRRMTPREAATHVSSADVEVSSEDVSKGFICAAAVALALGVIKFVYWLTGYSLLTRWLPEVPLVELLDGLLTFVAVPLFLFGFVGLLRWRVQWIQLALSAMTAPLAGKLRWFIAEHLALNRHRVTAMLFIASLATSLALLPQVAADTFYDRILRGIEVSVGADVQLEYSLADLTAGRDTFMSVPAHQKAIEGNLAAIEQALRADSQVNRVAVIAQFVAPDVYLPNQTGLSIDLIRSPEEYLQTVYYEENLGINRSLSSIVRDAHEDALTASTGLLALRRVPLDADMQIGRNGEDPIPARFSDVIAFLPGQPSMDVAQREGYAAAEVDYLNYLLGADARAVSTLERFNRAPLTELKVLPSRAVFVVRMKGGAEGADVARLTKALPIAPQNVRWLSQERQRMGSDMFISLALANMRVFLIGGLIFAIAGVVVIGLANFMAERRTFSLLRLRGLPMLMLLRVSLAAFLAPVVGGVVTGVLLGIVAGFGISEAVWRLPRVYGVAGLLQKDLVFSAASVSIIVGFALALLSIALGFALWPFRRSAHENVRKS